MRRARIWCARATTRVMGRVPLKRAIQKKIETPLGRLLLQGAVKDGQTVTVDVGHGGELTFKV